MYTLQAKAGGGFWNVARDSDGAFVPFDLYNRDCAQFVIDWQGGAAVLDDAGAAFPYSPENYAALFDPPPAGASSTSSTSSPAKPKGRAAPARARAAPAKKSPRKGKPRRKGKR